MTVAYHHRLFKTKKDMKRVRELGAGTEFTHDEMEARSALAYIARQSVRWNRPVGVAVLLIVDIPECAGRRVVPSPEKLPPGTFFTLKRRRVRVIGRIISVQEADIAVAEYLMSEAPAKPSEEFFARLQQNIANAVKVPVDYIFPRGAPL